METIARMFCGKERESFHVVLFSLIASLAFVRTISGLYAVCLLATFVRLQVSLIGKYLYIESITRAGTCHGRTMENVSNKEDLWMIISYWPYAPVPNKFSLIPENSPLSIP